MNPGDRVTNDKDWHGVIFEVRQWKQWLRRRFGARRQWPHGDW